MLPEINFDVLPKYSMSLIYGSARGNGKTTLITSHFRQIIAKRHVHKIYIFDPTLKNHHLYDEFDSIITELHTVLTPDNYVDILKDYANNHSGSKGTETIIVLDNIPFMDPNMPVFTDLILHNDIHPFTIFISALSLNRYNNSLLRYFDYYFVAHTDSYMYQHKIYTKLFYKMNLTDFNQLFQENTQNYKFLVMNRKTKDLFSHNANYLATTNKPTDDKKDEFEDTGDWLGVDNNNIRLSRQRDHDIPDKTFTIEV